jgi:pimeloyl-ACP methyl ester carboxylesterase
MGLAATVPQRLSGVILNDIGPVIEPVGLDYIMSYLGRPPAYATLAEAAEGLARTLSPRFANVPPGTWRRHAERLWIETPDGLQLRYDPKLRDAVIAQSATGETPDLWPLFEALKSLPTGLIRGANSDLLSPETAAEMRRRHPEMLYAAVPDRGHVPFLDEPEATALIGTFLERVA